jgi:peptidoglycan-associated lipoprotein
MTKNSFLKSFAMMLCVALLATGATGCKKKKSEPLDTGTVPPPVATSDGDGMGNPDLDVLNWTRSADLETIYFDYDRSDVRPDQVAKLQSNAAKIKAKAANVMIQIDGHCDERGTQEYNMALGERRALAVRQYLIQLGCDGSRILTVSYGEEMPEVMGSNEAAWAKNRRAGFNEAIRN